MSIKLKTALDCLSQSGGQRLTEANNIGAVEQMGPFGMNRSKGALYILVEAAGVSKSETERQLVDLIASEYEHAEGGITASLRKAITAANSRLYTNNQKALPEMRMAAGITCAVIRETDVFLAQSGPALAYVLHQDTFQRSPVDSPWLSPDRAGAFPYMFPLGKRPEVDPELFHSPLQIGDTLLLSTVALAHRIPQAQIKQIMGKGPAALIMRQVATLAGREDFSAVALEITEEAEEEEAAAAGAAEYEEDRSGGLLARARGGLRSLTASVGGSLSRLVQPLRGRGRQEEIEVPEMAPAPRVVPLARSDSSAGLEPVPARPYPPAQPELQDPQQYAQTGFLDDVVPPRGPRPLVDRPPLGATYEAEPATPWPAPHAGGEGEWDESDDEPEARGRLAGLSAAFAGAGAGLRGGLGRLTGRLRRQAPADEEPEMVSEEAEEWSAEAGGAAAEGSGDRGSLVGVPWRGPAGQVAAPDVEMAADDEQVEQPARPGFKLPAPGSRASLIGVAALALAALLVGGLAFVRYQEDQEKSRLFTQYMALAQDKRALVSPTTERAAARAALGDAEKAVSSALALRPDDPQATALHEGIQASLDSVNLVVRLNSVATLTEVPETNARLGRIVMNGLNLFFLDSGQNRVYKHLLTAPGATELQKLDVNPVLVRKGDEVGNIVAGDIVDIVWMPAGGARLTAQFMALESGGNLMAYSPSGGMLSLTVRDSGTWRKARSISSFQGNFYIMDTQQNRIFKYEPTARGYENSPIEWLKTAVDLTNMVDMAIDGDIYLLALDGKIQRFRGGLPLPYAQPELDRPIANPAGMFTSQEVQSIYVVDPANKRIVRLGKDGGFQRQYQYGGTDGAFDALRSVYVDEAQGKMYIVSGKKVLAASIPR